MWLSTGRRFGLVAVLALSAQGATASAQDAAPGPAAPPESKPSAESNPAYEQAISQAVSEFRAGRWEEARALFKRAHEIEPNARTLRGMGMTAFELRMYVSALRELDAALRDERKPLTDDQRASAQALLDRANAFVGRYQLVLEPAHARPHVDGQPVQFETGAVVLLDIGEHELTASADGYRTATRKLHVEGGQSVVLRIALDAQGVAALPPTVAPASAASPAPAAAPAPAAQGGSALGTAAWIALGSAAVLGAGAGAFWVVGEGQYDDLQAACGARGCSEAEIDDSGVATSDLLTNVFLGLAAAAGVGSVVLFVLDAGQGGEAEHARIELRVGPGGVRIAGQL